jgi:hypothetical protein
MIHSKVILGWRIDYNAARAFIAHYGAGTLDALDPMTLPLQPPLTITYCCPDERQIEVYLTLDVEGLQLDELFELCKPIDWYIAQEMAVQLGADDRPAELFSRPHCQ